MDTFDVIGIGAGPANLSLVALAEPLPLRIRLLEARSSVQWHPGVMLPEALLQVSFVKDLVTLVDPTSRFSFLNYLAAKGRLYRFLVACGSSGSFREEFAQYYQWVAECLNCVRWNSRVGQVQLHDDHFDVLGASGELLGRAKSLVLGTGQTPFLPEPAAKLHGPTVLHSAELLHVRPSVAGRDVLVVGGGQSGAEVVNHFLADDANLPASLTWVSSRSSFLPLDDSPFVNEWFMPSYVEHFLGLSDTRRQQLLTEQRMASDGVSESLLRSIYRRLYYLDITAGHRLRHRLMPGHRLAGLTRVGSRVRAEIRDVDRDRVVPWDVDVVVCATGYRADVPEYLAPIHDRVVDSAGGIMVRPDYSLDWDGPPELRIYVQNAAERTHGIADANLSLLAWRSARILNSLCGSEVYPVERAESTLRWAADPSDVLSTRGVRGDRDLLPLNGVDLESLRERSVPR